MQKNAMLGKLCGLLIIGLILASGVARGQSDPCNFNDGSTVFSYQRVMACYERVPFNPADLANAVAFLRAARERSDVREIMQARYNWRGELNSLATRTFANDHEFQIALIDNHKKLFNPHWSYRRPGCYTQFLASFIPFDFGSAVITPQGGAAQQIVFIEAAPYRADLYRSFTGIDANAYVGMRLLSVNGVPALDYFRRFGTEVYRFDQNAGQGLNEVLQNGAYSLRISSTQDVPSDRAFDVFELESQTGQRMTLEVPWVFARPSALGGFGSPLNLSNNTQQFTAICLQPSSVATLAGSPTASVPNAGLLETKAGGEEELRREIAEKREIVRQLNESNRGPRSDYFEEPPGRPSALLPVIVPKRDSAVAYQLSNRATIIRLDNFGGDWKEEVTAATNYACTNSDNLIFDMRNNGGGSIDQVGWLTRHLLPNRTAASDHTMGGRFLSSNPGRNELVSRLTQYSGSLGGTCRYGYEPWCFIDPVTEQPLPADGWGQGGTTEVRGGVVESLTRNALFRSNRPKYSETNPIACPGKFRGRSLIIYSNGTGFSAGYFWPALMRPDATIVTSGGFVGEPIVFGFGRGGAVWSMNNGEAYREQEMIRIYGPASNPLPFIVRNVESRIEAPASYQRGSTNLYTDDPAIGDVQIDVWTDSLATDEFVYTQVLNATPTPQADLQIVKTDNRTVVTTPGTTTYTLTVTNNGPAPAVDARVTDIFPAGVIVDNWTCLPQNEALCDLAGAGNINELVYVPVGGILTYTANVTIAANQTGTLVNTATVTAPLKVIDPNLANNTSTDTDTYGMSISGNVQQFEQGGPNTNLAGVLITAQPGGATATTNASGNFTIAGVPGTTYTLTPTVAGKVFDPVSRVVTSTANVTGVNFIAYNSPGGIPRNIFVVNSHATPGNPVTVPIRMTSQGTEKVMEFSIDYPLTSLFTPVVTCGASTPGCAMASVNVTPGKLGISITAAGAGVAAGLREIANVTFQTNIGFAPPNAALTFSTTPTAQSVRDAANNELLETFTNGFVVFVDGVESDVAGRNTGNGTVASTDVVQIRRFVANLDQLDPAFNEFQRADAAPLATNGDGALLPGDVVQARRYAASLDGPQAAAGPSGTPLPALGTGTEPVEERPEVVTDREFRLTTERADPGQNIGLGVEYSPQGDEAAVSFTVEYNAARLTNPKIDLGEGMPEGTVLTINENDAANGRIGILIDSTTPLGIGSNIKRLITITFDVAAGAAGGETRVRLTDSLAPKGVSDAMGNTLDAKYADGAVLISGPEATGTELSGRVTTADGRGVRGAQVTILDATGRARTVTTGTFGYYRFDDVAQGEAYTIGVNSRRYRFAPRVVQVFDTQTGVDFTGVK